jgi:predicted DsbA family dithiol-disulfide isomerase
MQVEIWSDVVCPWCYIGKRRFEAALTRFPHRDEVRVAYRSFELDPSATSGTSQSVREHLAHKYGVSLEQAAAMNERVSWLAAAEGLDYQLEHARYVNTFDAHRMIYLAAAHGLQEAAQERLMRAYFTEGEDIGDAETLVRVLAEIRVDSDEAREALASGAYADDVRADLRRARGFGIQGVPFFVVDEQYGISGAQPTDVMLDVLTRVWGAAHPLTVVGGILDGEVCRDDSCALPQPEDTAGTGAN